MRTHSPLHRDYLRRQCSDPFNDAARTVSGRLLSVRFLGPDDEPSKVATTTKRASSFIKGHSAISGSDSPGPQSGVDASASTAGTATAGPRRSNRTP